MVSDYSPVLHIDVADDDFRLASERRRERDIRAHVARLMPVSSQKSFVLGLLKFNTETVRSPTVTGVLSSYVQTNFSIIIS